MGKREEGNEWCLLNSFQVRNKVLVIFFMITIDIFNNISSIFNDLCSHMSGTYEGWDYNSKALNFLRRWPFLGACSSFIRKGFQNVPVNGVHKMLNFSFFEVGSLIEKMYLKMTPSDTDTSIFIQDKQANINDKANWEHWVVI